MKQLKFLEAALNNAINKEDVDKIEKLIKDNPFLLNNKQKGQTPVMLAIACNKSKSAVKLISLKADLYISDGTLKTPLIYACDKRNDALVKEILNNIPKEKIIEAIIHEDKYGNSPITIAHNNQYDGIKKILLDKLSPKEKSNHDALPITSSSNSLVSLEDVNKVNAAINKQKGDAQTTRAAIETSSNSDDNTKNNHSSSNIKDGSNMNTKDDSGRTALISAVQLKKIGLVKLLIEHNADLTTKDNDGKTALFYAKKTKNPELIKLLVDRLHKAYHFENMDKLNSMKNSPKNTEIHLI